MGQWLEGHDVKEGFFSSTITACFCADENDGGREGKSRIYIKILQTNKKETIQHKNGEKLKTGNENSNVQKQKNKQTHQ